MEISDKARLFASLHQPGRPLILFNAWDPGSARAVAEAGARAIATGSASVAAAHGFADPHSHDEAKVEEAMERARAYADAGASGFFVPGLIDLGLLARVCAGSPLPVNFMAFPVAPEAAAAAAAGVARISHGPFPYKLAMKALREAAEAACR